MCVVIYVYIEIVRIKISFIAPSANPSHIIEDAFTGNLKLHIKICAKEKQIPAL